jgi:hypothetical protein
MSTLIIGTLIKYPIVWVVGTYLLCSTVHDPAISLGKNGKEQRQV